MRYLRTLLAGVLLLAVCFQGMPVQMLAAEPIDESMIFAVCSDTVNVRDTPGEDGNIIAVMNNHASAMVLGHSGGWYEIQSGEVYGFVDDSFFVFGQKAQEIADEVAYQVAVVFPEELYVHKEASEESEVVATVHKGDELEVLLYSGNWMKIVIPADGGDIYGYISAYYVELHTFYPTARLLSEADRKALEKNASSRKEDSKDKKTDKESEKEKENPGKETDKKETDKTETEQRETELPEKEGPVKETQAPEKQEEQAPQTEETWNPETEELYMPETEETWAPETEEPYVPETEETWTPETETPYIPETQAPQTEAPYIPETQAPYIPETQAPQTEAPYIPETQAPQTEAPYVPETQEPYVPETEQPWVPEEPQPQEQYEPEIPDDGEYDDGGEDTGTIGDQLVNDAMQYLGLEYVPDGSSLETGVDSPGFVRSVLTESGIEIAGSVLEQSEGGTSVDMDDLQAGDLLFYSDGGELDHVGIYIGDGQIIHSAGEDMGVVVSDYDYSTPVSAVRYWE